MPEGPVILLAEDLEDDILLIQRSFSESFPSNQVHIVRDGEEAIEYLQGEGRYFDREKYPLPDVLMLDLKMPKMDGLSVLRWIRQQTNLKALRIVVLTSSQDIRDANAAYRLGASSFLVKPLDFQSSSDLHRFFNGQ